ncbi:ABC-type transporter, duplicated ATPase component [Corynebacterium kutscheri]|uniref:ABC-type sugar transport system, ATPase component n=1 Tax=Corynebacterium kutscheri TaxID=35755 RepID=A0A0F6QZC8_9CORY|nr:ABC-type sugar transport system, ATPase component [Corynebacterium kutscheri]VEH11042.1 ABC-type transporter, duplicated ATPase component [Corynebacterium kutscheri]VEH80479.1 ABC-type transporter, duplicated ATPase component [Corynebacterium kutscheri]
MNTPTAETVLELRKVAKSFGPVEVIKNVTLQVRKGKVLALLGENGAGKSTLIKMIAGIYAPDSGEIFIDGAAVTIPTAKASESLGIATIHQELNLVPTMSVAENIMLGRIPQKWGLVHRKHLIAQAQTALKLIGLDIDLHTMVGELGIAKQQLIEIAKALSMNARILILDEPTAALTANEIEVLFTLLGQLKEKGVAMIFISHHLEELARIADTIAVLRDGSLIAEVAADTPQPELVRLMVGHDINDQYPRQVGQQYQHGLNPDTVASASASTSASAAPSVDKQNSAPVLLEVTNLSATGKFKNINFTLHAGEVVGMAGLVGAGRTEVIRAISGADKYDTGSIQVNGIPLAPGNIAAAIKAGIGHIPEDRKAQALVLGSSVGENLGYATLMSTSRAGLADLRGQNTRARAVAEKLRIRMAHLNQPISSLSGGNQQKVIFGRWVLAGSTVLLLDEPTRGVDVGAKVEIYNIINEVTAAGGAVLMVSSDLPEILGMSDRILVLSGGTLAGELPAGASQDEVMKLAVSQVSSSVTPDDLTEATTMTTGFNLGTTASSVPTARIMHAATPDSPAEGMYS